MIARKEKVFGCPEFDKHYAGVPSMRRGLLRRWMESTWER